MNELLILQDDNEYPVDGRNLYERLEVETPYTMWFQRMCEYGFSEETDYLTKMLDRSDGKPGKPLTSHSLTLGMAKEICMIQRTEQGRQIRRYLIEIETQWNQPEYVMARALRMADQTIALLRHRTLTLEAEKSHLAVQTQIMAPKAEYFDELVERGVNLSIRESAKEIAVKEKAFVTFLVDHKYLYRDKKGKLMPYAQHAKDLFTLKECYNEKTSWGGTQTLITPKGRETFRLLMRGMSRPA